MIVPTLASKIAASPTSGRSIFIGLSILAGVAFVSGSFILADGLKGTFDNLFDRAHGRDRPRGPQHVLSVDEIDAVREPTPRPTSSTTVAGCPGVDGRRGQLFNRFAQMIDPDGELVTTIGASDARRVVGRRERLSAASSS